MSLFLHFTLPPKVNAALSQQRQQNRALCGNHILAYRMVDGRCAVTLRSAELMTGSMFIEIAKKRILAQGLGGC